MKKKNFVMFCLFVFFLLFSSICYAQTFEIPYHKIVEKDNTISIMGISSGTTIEDFANSVFPNEFRFYTSNGEEALKENNIQTGMYCTSNNQTYSFIVGGDVNCDGKVTQTDLFQIRAHLVGLSPLTSSSYLGADINGDMRISSTDILQVKKLLVGLTSSQSLYEEPVIADGYSYTKFKLTNMIRLDSISNTLAETLVIPETIANLPVVGIGNNCISENSTIKELFIPNTVTSIAPLAFNNWSGMLFALEDSTAIRYAQKTNTNYTIDKAPVVEQLSKTESPCHSASFEFSATDDGGITAWAITKKGETVSTWNEIPMTKTLTQRKDAITENGTYMIWLKDIFHISQTEVTIESIDYTAPQITSIQVISPNTGKYQYGGTVTIRVTFSEIITGTAPTLTVNVGEVLGTGTMQVSPVTGTTNYIDYIYTTTKQSGLLTISNYFGGNLTDLAGNAANITRLDNSGYAITILAVDGVEIDGRGIFMIPPTDQSTTYVYGGFGGDHKLTGNTNLHEGLDISWKSNRWNPGVPAYAVATGDVIEINRGNGKVLIDHGNGVYSEFFHLKGMDTTKLHYEQGELIAYSSTQGINDTTRVPPHVHFAILLNNINPDKPEEYYHVDPSNYISFNYSFQ